ncbi:metallophosphoesterase family protein [Aestuariivirga sp.]|uniref:metallophosphoesterase family protein n=1 Tax=Aestuariivirga sp. TaxID=2650926 RepID=UPI0039E693D7
MAAPFTLAHLSDVHLGPMPKGALWTDFATKRIIGWLSWELRRKRLHDPAVAGLIARDIVAQNPDHIALTGDLVNIASPAEFPRGARWMERLSGPEHMSFVPGNHDTYVPFAWDEGLRHFAPWMEGEMRVRQVVTDDRVAAPFPFVRLRKSVALIGVNSGVPQSLRKAGGTVGEEQLESLARVLRDLRERGYARVVMIHHPPLPGLAHLRKELTDAAQLQDVLVAEGAELVLHGHNHLEMLTLLETRFGRSHVFGVPSASMQAGSPHTPAGWNLYSITRQDGRWLTDVTVRSFDPETRTIFTKTQFSLST